MDNLEEFLAAAGLNKTSSFLAYGLSAMLNYVHFEPQATNEWRKHHSRAIDLALKARNGTERPARLKQDFDRIFYTSAFGDHFLHDAHVAGHMGFNRPGSTMGESRIIHNKFNRLGRWVQNRKGETWRTYGDGFLLSQCAALEPCFENFQMSASLSVKAVIFAFIFGEEKKNVSGTSQKEIARSLNEKMPVLFVPTESSQITDSRQFYPIESAFHKATSTFLPEAFLLKTATMFPCRVLPLTTSASGTSRCTRPRSMPRCPTLPILWALTSTPSPSILELPSQSDAILRDPATTTPLELHIVSNPSRQAVALSSSKSKAKACRNPREKIARRPLDEWNSDQRILDCPFLVHAAT